MILWEAMLVFVTIGLLGYYALCLIVSFVIAPLCRMAGESHRKREIAKWQAVYEAEGMDEEGAYLRAFYKVWRGIDYGRKEFE